MPLRGEVERRPIAAERFDHAVKQRRRCVEPEAPGKAAFAPAAACAAPSGVVERGEGEQQHGGEDRRQQRQRPPDAEHREQRHQQRRQRGAEPEQRVQRQHRAVRAARKQALDQRVQRHHRRAEAEAERAGGDAQQREGRGRADQQRTRREQTPSTGGRRSIPAAARRACRADARATARSAEARIASATWGMNIAPYCAPDRLKPEGLAKIALAAGNVTSARPCTTPAR